MECLWWRVMPYSAWSAYCSVLSITAHGVLVVVYFPLQRMDCLLYYIIHYSAWIDCSSILSITAHEYIPIPSRCQISHNCTDFTSLHPPKHFRTHHEHYTIITTQPHPTSSPIIPIFSTISHNGNTYHTLISFC